MYIRANVNYIHSPSINLELRYYGQGIGHAREVLTLQMFALFVCGNTDNTCEYWVFKCCTNLQKSQTFSSPNQPIPILHQKHYCYNQHLVQMPFSLVSGSIDYLLDDYTDSSFPMSLRVFPLLCFCSVFCYLFMLSSGITS